MPKVLEPIPPLRWRIFFALTFAVFLQGGVGEAEIFGRCAWGRASVFLQKGDVWYGFCRSPTFNSFAYILWFFSLCVFGGLMLLKFSWLCVCWIHARLPPKHTVVCAPFTRSPCTHEASVWYVLTSACVSNVLCHCHPKYELFSPCKSRMPRPLLK